MKTEGDKIKHAYCIIAHADPFCLSTLIELLDNERTDIFLLPDKKSPRNLTESLECSKSNLHIIPYEERIDIRWGGLSQVKAELLLFENVLKTGKYAYIHLLSGADLPLKPQQKILDYFDSLPEGTNLVCFSHGPSIEENVDFKTRYFHPFVEYQRFRKEGNFLHLFQDLGAKGFRKLSVGIQRLSNFRRKWKDLTLKKGSQWISITQDFTTWLVDNKEYILKNFKGVICPDEIFVQTMLYNSPFRSTIRDYKGELDETVRLIDWSRGNPYVWRKEDFKELTESGALFARKFSSTTDKEIILKIKESVLNGI